MEESSLNIIPTAIFVLPEEECYNEFATIWAQLWVNYSFKG